MTTAAKTDIAKREARLEAAKEKTEGKVVDMPKTDSGSKPIDGTEPKG